MVSETFKIFIECSTKKLDDCKGEFVLTIYDTCYFLYEYNNTYRNIDINKLCMERNKTEIDLPTSFSDNVLVYLTMIFYPESKYETYPRLAEVPWKYSSEKKIKKKP